jgi:hypothetical protein
MKKFLICKYCDYNTNPETATHCQVCSSLLNQVDPTSTSSSSAWRMSALFSDLPIGAVNRKNSTIPNKQILVLGSGLLLAASLSGGYWLWQNQANRVSLEVPKQLPVQAESVSLKLLGDTFSGYILFGVRLCKRRLKKLGLKLRARDQVNRCRDVCPVVLAISELKFS